METIIKEIQSTPLPTILILAGVLVVVLAFVTKIGGVVEVSSEQRRWAIPVGLFLLTIGLILNFSTPSPTSTPSSKPSLSSNSAVNADGNTANQMLMSEIVGAYENHTYDGTNNKNNWHYVTISKVNDTTLEWKNKAGVSWLLTTTPDKTKLNLGEDSPYYKDAKQTSVIWEEGRVTGLEFMGELYQKSS